MAARRPSAAEGRFLIPSSEEFDDGSGSREVEDLLGFEFSLCRRNWSLHCTQIDARTEGRLYVCRDREAKEGFGLNASFWENRASGCMTRPSRERSLQTN